MRLIYIFMAAMLTMGCTGLKPRKITVSDEYGNPIRNAGTSLQPLTLFENRSDAKGRIRVYGLGPDFPFTLHARGFRSKMFFWGDPRKNFSLASEKEGSESHPQVREVEIVDEHGNPIEGAKTTPVRRTEFSPLSDESGRLRVMGYGPRDQFSIYAKGYVVANFDFGDRRAVFELVPLKRKR